MPEDIIAQTDNIERRILVIRGHKVLLDTTLAAIYGVTSKRLNEQVNPTMARVRSLV